MNLTSLNCSNNQLTSLDMSQNTALNFLLCYSNQLTSLYFHDTLNNLESGSNQLTRFVIPSGSLLIHLNLFNNNLTDLDVTNGLFLESLEVESYINQSFLL